MKPLEFWIPSVPLVSYATHIELGAHTGAHDRADLL